MFGSQVGGMRRKVVAGALSAAALTAAPAAAQTGLPDQDSFPAGETCLTLASPQSVAQTFTAGTTGTLDRVDLSLRTVAMSVTPVTVEIRDVDTGTSGTRPG